MTSIAYRVWQVWRLLTQRLTAQDVQWIRDRLSPAQQALFFAQERGDQVHAYRVAHALATEGYRDDPLIITALLHDCGKAPGVNLFYRTLVVVLKKTAPHFLYALTPHTTGWRAPLARAWHHPRLGAALAAAAGSSADVVRLIEIHQERTATLSPTLLPLLTALQTVDDAN